LKKKQHFKNEMQLPGNNKDQYTSIF